jgi:hypothetical protein
MSQVMRTTGVHHAVFGLALASLAIASVGIANAGDFDAPAYRPYPYGAPVNERMIERDGVCRIFHERRLDPYGRETIHRIQMCDEGPIYSPNRTAAPQEYGYNPQRYYEPSSPDYDSYPRPPAAIGSTYYYN